GGSARFKRLLKFNTICLIGLALDVLLLNIFYNIVFQQNLRYVANLIAIGLAALWNFWINLKLNWRTAAVLRRRPY
ncbi:MAG: GtrA family protein, partial [Phormidesmis sp.]